MEISKLVKQTVSFKRRFL